MKQQSRLCFMFFLLEADGYILQMNLGRDPGQCGSRDGVALLRMQANTNHVFCSSLHEGLEVIIVLWEITFSHCNILKDKK